MKTLYTFLSGLLTVFMSSLIRAYQLFVSPLFPTTCRFAPSCSHYALVAIRRHGPIYGGRMAIGRILRCHPWSPGGYDPVP